MIACEDERLKTLLKENAVFRMNFEKLMKAFEERMWTKDVCVLFVALCESLFEAHKLPVKVHMNDGLSNGGRFRIEFLTKPEEEKKVDRSILDVLKWMVRK